MGKFTGKNRDVAKWLGEPLDTFEDPGFCLACGETDCICDMEGSELEEWYKSDLPQDSDESSI